MKGREEADFSRPEAQPFLWEGGDHGVLLIHGFTGSVAHMRLLGEQLRDAGFTVMGINLPGHATRLEDMRSCTAQEWYDAARAALMTLKERCRQVSVSGLSMGGVLTLLLAESEGMTAAIPISAPMGVQSRFMPFAGVAAPFVKTVRWKPRREQEGVMDVRYDLGYTGFPTRSAVALNRLMQEARVNLAAVRCPLLVVQSHSDETIAPASADIILQGVSSQDKRMLWLRGVPHVCTISREHERIGEAMVKLLRDAEQQA